MPSKNQALAALCGCFSGGREDSVNLQQSRAVLTAGAQLVTELRRQEHPVGGSKDGLTETTAR